MVQKYNRQQKTIRELEISTHWIAKQMDVDEITHNSEFSHEALRISVHLKNGTREEGLFYRYWDGLRVCELKTIPDFVLMWDIFDSMYLYKLSKNQDRRREEISEEISEETKEYKIWDCNRYNHCQDDDGSCIECSIDNRKYFE